MPVGREAHSMAREQVMGAAQKLRVGDGLQPGVDMGPVVSAAARDRLVGAITRGVSEGADPVLDGRSVQVPELPHGYFVGPTVLDGVSPEMSVYREELFGPVLSVSP